MLKKIVMAAVSFDYCSKLLSNEIDKLSSTQAIPSSYVNMLKSGLERVKSSISSKSNKNSLWIVFEGFDEEGAGKTTCVNNLSQHLRENDKLSVFHIKTPPPELTELRPYFDKHEDPQVTKAFYHFGNYLAVEILKSRTEDVFILDRFWVSTVSVQETLLAEKENRDLPAENSPIYSWPPDLYKPETCITIYLDLSEEERRKRIGERDQSQNTVWEQQLEKEKFRNTVRLATQRIKDITRVESAPTPQATLQRVYDIVKQLLPKKD